MVDYSIIVKPVYRCWTDNQKYVDKKVVIETTMDEMRKAVEDEGWILANEFFKVNLLEFENNT